MNNLGAELGVFSASSTGPLLEKSGSGLFFETMKPPVYQLFRVGTSSRFTVLQVRSVKDGKALNAPDLTAYTVLQPVETPWWKIRIGKGSRMILADDAAAPLLAQAMIEPLFSETLVPWRPAYEADKAAKYESRRKDRQR